jgi:small-conductance mechanosensitive channel
VKQLLKPAVLLILAGAFCWGAFWGLGPDYDPRDPANGPLHPWLALGGAVLLWFFASWTVASIVQLLCWHPLETRYSQPIPRLLKILGKLLFGLLAGAAVIEFVYRKSVTTLWAASGFAGLGLVLGLKDLLQDLFSGVLLNLEQPFRIHDKIRILDSKFAEAEGQVIDIDWRSTRLRTVRGDLVVIPNSVILASGLINITRELRLEKGEVTFQLDHTTAVDWGRSVLLKGITGCGAVLPDPAPVVLVSAVHPWGVEYTVQYHYDLNRLLPPVARDQAIRAVLEQIQRNGLTMASQKHEVLMRQEVQPAKRA